MNSECDDDVCPLEEFALVTASNAEFGVRLFIEIISFLNGKVGLTIRVIVNYFALIVTRIRRLLNAPISLRVK